MNYTESQILEGLKECATSPSKSDCGKCAFKKHGSKCVETLTEKAANLIELYSKSENMHDQTCGKCSRFEECKPYVDESETFPEVGGCSAFRHKLKVVLDEGAKAPTRAHALDAGLDLYSKEKQIIPAKESATFDTGVHVEIPKGFVGMLKSKSGLNVKHGITGEGTIDAGYTGSIRVKLYNSSGFDYVVEAGDKIIQLVILPIITPDVQIVDSLDETDRGDNGFGSSGK